MAGKFLQRDIVFALSEPAKTISQNLLEDIENASRAGFSSNSVQGCRICSRLSIDSENRASPCTPPWPPIL